MVLKLLMGVMLIISVVLLFGVYQTITSENKDVRSRYGITTSETVQSAIDRLTQLREPREEEEEPREEPIRPLAEVVRSVEVPWDMVFLPNGSMLVSERPGRVVLFDQAGNRAVVHTEQVFSRNEAGLLGMVLHPKFNENRFVYLYRTVTEGSETLNRIDRYVFTGSQFTERTTIIDNIPGAAYHDGGRIEFGPDRKLYVATGDANVEANAQDLESLAGKILRLNDDGSVPTDNPFPQSPVYSLGHRNPQGLAWDNQGRLWATEHGPSSQTFCCRDELNLIEAGKNYGWPEITADETKEGMERPVLHSGTFTTWAPSSLAMANSSFFFGGLRGEALYEVRFEAGEPVVYEHFKNEYGRIRTVRVGPDGMLYFTTSNRDGRGQPKVGDDKIMRVDPRSFRSQPDTE